jgi:hypothetical protein
VPRIQIQVTNLARTRINIDLQTSKTIGMVQMRDGINSKEDGKHREVITVESSWLRTPITNQNLFDPPKIYFYPFPTNLIKNEKVRHKYLRKQRFGRWLCVFKRFKRSIL